MKIEDQGRPTVAIDVESPDHKDHWEEYSAELRGKCPVAWSTARGGHWIVSSYEDVVRIADHVVNEEEEMPCPSISPINGWVNIPASFTPGPRSGIPEPSWLHAATSGGHH